VQRSTANERAVSWTQAKCQMLIILFLTATGCAYEIGKYVDAKLLHECMGLLKE
jgi:hypothetical protein